MALPYDYATMLLFHERYRDLEMNHYGEPQYVKHICDGWPATFDLGWKQFKQRDAMDQKPQIDLEAKQESPKKKTVKFFCKTDKLCPMINKVIYMTFVFLTLLSSFSIMVLAVECSAISRNYAMSESGRAAYMIVVAVTAGITVSTLGYSVLGICRSSSKPLHIVAGILFACTIMHIAIALTSVKLTQSDVDELERSLDESFQLGKRGYPDQSRIWGQTQSDLKCCGFNGPDDYRRKGAFPPDVHITCCPAYDSDEYEKYQEDQRQLCAQKGYYYTTGCKYVVTSLFHNSAYWIVFVLYLTAGLEFTVGVLSLATGKYRKWQHNKEEKAKEDNSLPKISEKCLY